MGLEAATYLNDLVTTNPTGIDGRAEGDDHIRLIKAVLQATLPGMSGRFRRVVTKSSGFTLALTDNSVVFRTTAALVAQLPAAATPGNGFHVAFFNDSLFNITITPNGTERINGVNASVTLAPNSVAELVCNNVASAEWLFSPVALNSADLIGANITGNTTLTAADINNGTRRITASAVVTLPPVANVPLHAKIRLKSVTTGDVTFVPNAAETLDGITGALRIPSYRSFTIQANATDWIVVEEPDVVVGELKMVSAGVAAPRGWVLADFAAISRTTYAGLFAVTGTANGAGDGSTTFNTYDSRGRSPMGDGTGSGLSARTVGNKVGEESHLMTEAEMFAHTHTAGLGNSDGAGSFGQQVTSPSGNNITTSSRGGSTPFNVVHPINVARFMVKT